MKTTADQNEHKGPSHVSKKTKKTIKHGDVMVWGCFAAFGLDDLN